MSRITKLAAGVGLVLGIAACGETTGLDTPLMDRLLTNDIAQVAADGAGDDVESMRGLNIDLRTGFGFFPAPSAAPGRDCPFNAATGYHVCPELNLGNGLKINRSYGFFDASGGAMESYDDNQTASIHILKSSQGDIERSADDGTRWTASVDHARDKTVSGLQGDEQTRTWNGTGTSEISRARFPSGAEAADRSYEVSSNVTVTDVVIPHFNNDAKDPWPLSGTITKVITGSVTVTRDGETQTREISRTVVITFDGTQFASMTVNGETFEVDLAARRAHRENRRP